MPSEFQGSLFDRSSSAEVFHARICQWLESVLDWLAAEADWRGCYAYSDNDSDRSVEQVVEESQRIAAEAAAKRPLLGQKELPL